MRRKPSAGNIPAAERHCIWLICRFPDEIAVQSVCDSIGSYHQPRNCRVRPTPRRASHSGTESNGIWTSVDFGAYLCYCDTGDRRSLVGRDAAAVCTVLSCNLLKHNLCLATLDLRSSNCALCLRCLVRRSPLPQRSRQSAVLPIPWCRTPADVDHERRVRMHSAVRSLRKSRASRCRGRTCTFCNSVSDNGARYRQLFDAETDIYA